MMTTNALKNYIEDYVTEQLQEKIFEDLLEEFDVTPSEAFLALYHAGLIDLEFVEETDSVR